MSADRASSAGMSGARRFQQGETLGREEYSVTQEPLTDLVKDIGELVIELFKKEAELSRAEMERKARRYLTQAKKLSVGYALLGAAGVSFLAALILAFHAFFTRVAGISDGTSMWLAPLVVGALLGAIGIVSTRDAKEKFEQIDPVPRRTVQNVKEDISWLKNT